MQTQNKKEAVDKRKIVLLAIALLLVAIFIILGSSKLNFKNNQAAKKETKGISTKTVDPIKEVKSIVEEQIKTIQTEVKKIDVVEVASSSPQIQKIINDIKSLENYPQNQAKNLCEQICNSL